MAVVFALLAALGYAAASVLQQRAAAEVGDEHSLKIGLLVRLLKRPMWLAGFAADWVAFAFQAAALATGSLLLVQPLLTTGLLFALPIGARWSGRRLRGRDWVAAIVLTVGLGVFLYEGSPTGGKDRASFAAWIPWLLGFGIAAGICVVVAWRARGTTRALSLALATGLLYGATAALTKSSANLLGNGVVALVTAWEPYALAGVALVGMVLAQSAFQAGNLEASLPTLTVSEPIIAAMIGVGLFAERLRVHHSWQWIVIGISVVAMIAGVAILAPRKEPVTAVIAAPDHGELADERTVT
jgi:drug/metabolite transporter (DMT)-like permease